MTDKVDFGAFGAKTAFPGDLTMSWGACLVEPPSIGALREQGSSKLVRLGDLAPARSGIPPRVAGYFCLEELSDPDVVQRFGIRSQRDRQRYIVVRDGRGAIHTLERAALRPLIRRPGLLEGYLTADEDATAPWHMLYLSDDRIGLETKRWDRTLAYIRYGETQDFPAKEGSRRAGGVPAERAQVKVRPVWFQVPRIPTEEGRVGWLKGRGDSHYAPTLGEGVLVLDNFLYSVRPQGLAHERAFAATANLSWTHLMAEINGRRGGGDGVLHTYIRELNRMPLIDPRRLTKGQADDFVGLFDKLATRSALSVNEELKQPDRQEFDRWAMEYLFGDDAPDAGRAVELALRDLVRERNERTASGRDQAQKATQRTEFNPAPVAARLLIDHGVPPRIVQMLGEDDSGSLLSLQVEIPAHTPGVPELGRTLLDQGCVIVGDEKLIEAPSDAHAHAIVAHLMTNADFSGVLELPSDQALTEQVASQWDKEWRSWAEAVRKAVKEILPRPQHEVRRVQVIRELEQQAHLAPGSVSNPEAT